MPLPPLLTIAGRGEKAAPGGLGAYWSIGLLNSQMAVAGWVR